MNQVKQLKVENINNVIYTHAKLLIIESFSYKLFSGIMCSFANSTAGSLVRF